MLPAIRSQALDAVDGSFPVGIESVEIVATDSSSQDGSVALLEEHGALVESIEQSEFSHGGTRNHCAARARGDILVFLSQDVLPKGDRFLSELVAAFADSGVAGVCSRVLPEPDTDALTARTVLDLPESGTEGWTRSLEGVEGVWELDPEVRGEYLRFNNVASAIRADVFREIPFPEVAFGEDFAWAARALTAGYEIAFAPRAEVYHSHAYSMGKAFDRYRQDALFHYLAHGLRLRPTVRSALRGFLYEVWRDTRYLVSTKEAKSRTLSMLRSPGLRAAQVAGQYAGSRGWQASGSERGLRVPAMHL